MTKNFKQKRKWPKWAKVTAVITGGAMTLGAAGFVAVLTVPEAHNVWDNITTGQVAIVSIADLQADNAELTADNTEILAAYLRWLTAYNTTHAELIEVETALAEEQAKTTADAETILSLRTQVATNTTQIGVLESSLDIVNSDKTALQIELDNAYAQKTAIQTALDNAYADKTAMQTELDNINSQIGVLESSLNSVSADKIALQTELDNATIQLNELQAQLDSTVEEFAAAQSNQSAYVILRTHTKVLQFIYNYMTTSGFNSLHYTEALNNKDQTFQIADIIDVFVELSTLGNADYLSEVDYLTAWNNFATDISAVTYQGVLRIDVLNYVSIAYTPYVITTFIQ